MKKKWVFAAALAVLAAAGIIVLASAKTRTSQDGSQGKKSFEYATIAQGSIEKSISTSGSLEPVSTVKVLAQMSGRVEAVRANYNDKVSKGQVLASINTDMLKLQRLESEAAVRKAQASHDLQLLDFQNKTKLAAKGLVSDFDLATSKTSLAVLAAELASAQASLQVIETEINDYALIKAPISGVILDKNIEVGQNVVEGSSSNSTTLFTLAEDLDNMEIEATVDELDIASVKAGQEVRFTVDSKPGITFSGRVKELHLIPETSNSIVNYYVIISAPNRDGSLLPGMTATISFIEDKKSNILVVPNSALRFVPSALSAAEIARKTYFAGLGSLSAAEKAAAEARYDAELAAAAGAAKSGTTAAKATGLTGMMMGGPGMGGPGGPPGSRTSAGTASGTGPTAQATAAAITVRKALWYLDANGDYQCVLVTVGVSDGINTEVSGAEGLEGMKVILKEKAE
jgi:HlyD family secretion protein